MTFLWQYRFLCTWSIKQLISHVYCSLLCIAILIIIHVEQIDVSFSCVCPVVDHKFCHNIVKVAVDPRGTSRVDLRTTLTVL